MIRVALLGFGFMGRTHAARILRHPAMELTAVVRHDARPLRDSLRDATGNFQPGTLTAEALAGVPVYATLRECLDREAVDAVDICLPTLHHFEAADEALARGKHVLVEKPFVLDLDQGRRLIERARAAARVLMVAQVVRFMPEYAFLRESVESGCYGAARWISTLRRTGVPTWGDWGRRSAVREASGGALFDLVVHDIDAMRWMFGDPDEIDSHVRPGPMSDADFVRARWQYDSGLEVFLDGGFTLPSSSPFEARCLAQFERAFVEFTTAKPGIVTVAEGEELREIAVETEPDGFQREIDYFAECVETGRPPALCDPVSSLRSIELAWRHIENTEEGD